jgi:dolichol kinase
LEKNEIPLKYFLIRKIIHLLFGIISVTALLLIPNITQYLLLLIAGLFIFFDLLRRREGKWREQFYKTFGNMLKSTEIKGRITGATTFWMTVAGLSFSLPQNIVILAVLILSIADPLASIIGRVFPVKRIWHEKSLMGSATFFLSSFVIYYVAAPSFVIPHLFATFLVTLIELFAPEVLENILIGFGAAIIFTLIF